MGKEHRLMEVEIRLKKILQQHRLDKHGIIQEIAADLRVHRHSIGKLYRNEATHPSRKLVGQLCGWLIEQGVPADRLPHALFGARPAELWESIAAGSTVSIYLGEYQQTRSRLPALQWISRPDAEALADIVEYLSMPGNVGEPRPQVVTEYVPFRFDLKSPDRDSMRTYVKHDAQQVKSIFDQMRSREPACSAILIGSQRVNYLLEYLVADLFGCQAFRSVRRRGKVPFYLQYRERDRDVESCFGGRANPPGLRTSTGPGTYFLNEKEEWVACPWQEREADSGIVITVRDPGDQSAEMAMFGFSGRATVVVSKQLTKAGHEPKAQSKGRQVGVYVCRFSLDDQHADNPRENYRVKKLEVLPICESVLQSCLR
jgi:hypothetical protein